MNISGIRPSLGFYSYNSIKIDELRNQQLAVTAQEQAPMQEESTGYKDQLPVEQNFTSYDYAKSYQPDETYELKGAESDISKLDVEKTMSDLEKDKVLEQYQYFVLIALLLLLIDFFILERKNHRLAKMDIFNEK